MSKSESPYHNLRKIVKLLEMLNEKLDKLVPRPVYEKCWEEVYTKEEWEAAYGSDVGEEQALAMATEEGEILFLKVVQPAAEVEKKYGLEEGSLGVPSDKAKEVPTITTGMGSVFTFRTAAEEQVDEAVEKLWVQDAAVRRFNQERMDRQSTAAPSWVESFTWIDSPPVVDFPDVGLLRGLWLDFIVRPWRYLFSPKPGEEQTDD